MRDSITTNRTLFNSLVIPFGFLSSQYSYFRCKRAKNNIEKIKETQTKNKQKRFKED